MQRKSTDLIHLPSEKVLQARLREIILEARRLRLMIRTGRELERIAEQQSQTKQGAEHE